jgi:hypothetical protein
VVKGVALGKLGIWQGLGIPFSKGYLTLTAKIAALLAFLLHLEHMISELM